MLSELNILLIDDDAVDRMNIARSIQKFSTYTKIADADCTQTALEMLQNQTFDAVLLDFSLPDSVGLESLAKINAMTNNTTPIIMLSGTDDEATLMEQSIHNGAQDYLIKDETNGKQILRAIRYGIQRKRLEQELKLAIEAEKAATATKDRFLAAISHDLRTPFTAIQGSLKLITSGLYKGIPSEVATLAEVAYNNTERLLHIVNDLLDHEKISAGEYQYHITKYPIDDCIRQAIEMTEAFASNNGKQIAYSAGDNCMHAYCDSNRVVQILVNLLSNAIKFSQKCIHISISQYTPDGVVIAIHDDGAGIPLQHQDKIFESYYQVNNATDTGMNSTGLGLSICKQMSKDQDGDVYFDSMPNNGTTFFLRLPIQHPTSKNQ